MTMSRELILVLNRIANALELMAKRDESIQDSDLIRPSLSETKDILIKILRDNAPVVDTKRLRTLLLHSGYSVKLNSLRYVLNENKDLFIYSKENRGWCISDLGRLLHD